MPKPKRCKMGKQIISTGNAPKAIGPYSQAIKTDQLIFTSGQIAINPTTGKVEQETIEGQAVQVLENLKAVLEAAGSDLNKVLKTTCYLADMDDFKAFNLVYSEYFGESMPARATVAVKTLPLNVLVEIDAIALV